MKKNLHLLLTSILLCGATTHAALVSHFTFDELTGTTATDSGPAAANGVIGANVVLGTTGVFGTAYTFPNEATAAGIVDMGNATGLFTALTGSQQLTISVWLNFTTPGGRDSAVFLGSDSSATRYIDIGTTSAGAMYGRSRDAATTTAPFPDLVRGTALNDGKWHHVAYTTNAATDITSIYIDGVLEGTTTTPVFTFPAFNNFEVGRLGRGAPTDAFGGSIDELRIYDTVLTPTEIAALAVPEPGAAVISLLGLTGMVIRRRK